MRSPKLLPVLFLALVLTPTTQAAAVTVDDCKGAGTPSINNGCGDVDDVGCCDAFGRVLWCQGGDLYCNDCTDGFEYCGWFDLLEYYDCGAPEPEGDPTGAHPFACGPSCGDCGPGEVCLDDGTCHLPQCQGKECGKDPMGISCGTCDFGFECVDGLFQCLPYPAACLSDDGPGCDGCACESCVCAKYPHCCAENWDIFCASACEQECGFDCSPCPASPSCEGIECGGFCGVDCGSCPANQVCYGALCCTPDCDGGKECGPDGCGGSCGQCPGLGDCVDGFCVACQPKCQGKECGPDACGGTCGDCPAGWGCAGGQCTNEDSCVGNCGQQAPGGCYCDELCKSYQDCCEDVCDACPQVCGCEPDCAGKDCGDDGCGGSCGHCAGTEICQNGTCVACEPDCAGKDCGDDGCGGSCGNCTGSDICQNGSCVACQPACDGKDCGDDGCGGSCGECPADQSCESGACQEDPCGGYTWEGCCEDNVLYYCEQSQIIDMNCADQGGPCGWEAGEDYYNCNTAGEPDPSGEFPMACPGACEPDCEGKECGPDGCEGTCGDCPAKQMICLSDGTCCDPDCLGKVCGDDGCGGTCGQCPDGQACDGGQCLAVSDPGDADPSPDMAETVDPDAMTEPMPDVIDDAGSDTGSAKDLNIGWKDLNSGDKGTAGTDVSVTDGGGGSGSNCAAGPSGGPLGAGPVLVLTALFLVAMGYVRKRSLAAAPALAVLLVFQVGCSSDGPGLETDVVPPIDAMETVQKDVKSEGLAKPDLKTDKGTPVDIPDPPLDPGPVDTVEIEDVPETTDLAEELGLPDEADLPETTDTFDLPDPEIETIDDTSVDDIHDVPDITDTASDPGMEASDALDAPEEVETIPPYDCSQIPQGPFPVVEVPNAIASEDLAFDGKGNLIGSNNSSIYKTSSKGTVNLFAPNVQTRSAMRMLPNGILAVNDDKQGRVLLFDPDGVMTVLVTGLNYPNGMAVDLQGYIYVAEENANRVIRIHSYTGDYTVLTKAISHPNGITFNATYDRLYIGSFGSPKIYTMTLSPDGIPGKVTVFHEFPLGSLMDGMGVDVCGNVYVCEYNKTEIWRITPDGKHKKKIVDPSVSTYLPNLQWGRGVGWDPLSIYVPDGWDIGVWRIEIGVPSAPLPFP